MMFSALVPVSRPSGHIHVRCSSSFSKYVLISSACLRSTLTETESDLIQMSPQNKMQNKSVSAPMCVSHSHWLDILHFAYSLLSLSSSIFIKMRFAFSIVLISILRKSVSVHSKTCVGRYKRCHSTLESILTKLKCANEWVSSLMCTISQFRSLCRDMYTYICCVRSVAVRSGVDDLVLSSVILKAYTVWMITASVTHSIALHFTHTHTHGIVQELMPGDYYRKANRMRTRERENLIAVIEQANDENKQIHPRDYMCAYIEHVWFGLALSRWW